MSLLLRHAALLGLLATACAREPRGLKRAEPPLGNIAGGEPVTIVGAGFAPGATGVQVRFGRALAKNASVDSASQIRVITPAGAPGPADVEVAFDDGGYYLLRGGFRFVETGVRNPWEHFGEKKAP